MNQNLLPLPLRNQLKTPDAINIIVLIATWIVMVILVNPIGDFPLNDDWAYGRSVQSLIEKGDFQLSDWTATNLFSQVLWGALFCLPFGFSFTALRFSTLILGLIGVVTTYGLFREINTSYRISLLGALLVAINPIYFELSHTFMNDVPFFAFTTGSLYFLLRGLKYESKIAITFGFLMAGVAILSRQAGLAIPLAFGCAYIIKKGFVISNFVKGFSPTLIGIALQLGYQKWLQLTMRSPQSYGDQINTLVKEVSLGLSNVYFNYSQITLFSLIYLGLFILPLLILSAFQNFNSYSNRKKTLLLLATSFFFVVALHRLIPRKLIMPFVGNILVDFGLGPVGLINSYLPQAPRIWIAATAIGLVGAALLLQNLFLAIGQILARGSSPETLEKKWVTTLILSFVAIYFFPLGLLGLTWQGFYDRYLIALLPFVMMTALVCQPKNRKNIINSKLMPLILIVMLIGSGFTIAGTHDYLSSNRVLWQALNNLMQTSQISPERINGGFEFRGWYLCNKKLRNSPDKYINFSCLWETGKEEYVMAFKPIDGYHEIKRYPFSSWMPFTQKNVLVLQKIK